jgi:hypothetical protein
VALALEAGEVSPDVDPEGAVALIEAIGAGLTLLAGAAGRDGEGEGAFDSALDVLDRLLAGTLFAEAGGDAGPAGDRGPGGV